MFAVLWAKFEVYFIVAAVSLIAALGWGEYRHHSGYKEAVADAQVALDKANAKTEALQTRLEKSAETQANELTRINLVHAGDLVAAASNVKPVIVRIPADSSQVSAPGSSTGAVATGTNGSADVPMSTERDIGPTLVMLAGECQRDRDALIGWQNWYAQQTSIAGW